MEYTHAVFIGRFQPPHNLHFEVIRRGLALADELIIVVGSSNSASSVKNPFSFDQRCEMFESVLTDEELSRIHFVPVRDYFYSENTWVADVQRKVSEISDHSPSIVLLGSYKDASSYYLNMFPQWSTEGISSSKFNTSFGSTQAREALFTNPNPPLGWTDRGGANWKRFIPEPIIQWIEENFIDTETFLDIQADYQFLKKYKDSWKDAPYPPTFVTADAVVIKSGHILIIERKIPPGRRLLALPGGFIKQGELIRDAAIRELKEETRIDVPKAILDRGIVSERYFDYPGRSSRGRTITFAFCIDLGTGKELPKVKGSDDALGAKWLPLMDLGFNESRFFEDHFHIINYFVSNR